MVDGVTVRNPIPALATFFFTDYTYHSSMDTMKALSAHRLRMSASCPASSPTTGPTPT